MEIRYHPIGTIFSPFENREGMPIQPSGAAGVKGKIVMKQEFAAGLKDLEGFSHLMLLYHFHLAGDVKLQIVPFLDHTARGLFSTRAPNRPNPIGLSVVGLDRIENNILYISNVDILNQTPLLDIKPYVPEFDQPEATRWGWLEKSSGEVKKKRSDDRFS
jgi:tRNA-Thr(GGU) m(6)t(6)A37 methyltransferase TsaA